MVYLPKEYKDLFPAEKQNKFNAEKTVIDGIKFASGRESRMYSRPRQLPGIMNKTEKAYAEYLDSRILCGEVIKYMFEKLKFKLAGNTFYTPDFYVVTPELIEIHEVKGFWEDDARVKIKVAAEMFPEFKWIAVMRKKGEWIFEEI